jgi:hypothetical protein
MTLTESAKGVSGFMVVFFTIMFGFSQAHCMCFQTGLGDFKTLGDTIFTLGRSLLGDFDFSSMQEEGPVMGPFLFILFVGLAVFVVLNMLIAIISDAYESSKSRMEQVPDKDLAKDLLDYMVFKLLLNPRFHAVIEKLMPGRLDRVLQQYQGIAQPSRKVLPSVHDESSGGSELFEVTAHGSLMLELEQTYTVAGQLNGATVCTEPANGPLKGKVRVDDLRVSVDGQSLQCKPLAEIGAILGPKRDSEKVLVFERIRGIAPADGPPEGSMSDTERMGTKIGKIEKDIAGMADSMEQLQKQMAAMLQLMGTKPQLRV